MVVFIIVIAADDEKEKRSFFFSIIYLIKQCLSILNFEYPKNCVLLVYLLINFV